jgi:hypothetical protein
MSFETSFTPTPIFVTTTSPTTPFPAGGGGILDRSVSSLNTTERHVTDYYSGSQVSIFLGDVWLNDISMIEFQLTQNKTPFYGYKSQNYDVMAKGVQIIDGVFSMAYTHTNYLNMVISKYLETTNPGSGPVVSSTSLIQYINDVKSGKVDTDLVNLSYGTRVADGTAASLQRKDNAFVNQTFVQKQQQLEQYFWGTQSGADQHKILTPDNLPSFDITIAFGNYPKDRPSAQDEFLSSHTIKVLSSVEIVGYSMQLAITGEPIQEVYAFKARAMDLPLTRVAKDFIVVSDTRSGTNQSAK